ncbi:hypothetical protein OKHIL_69700 [Mycolicibacterium mageritense]|nr:hypothetical protein MTY414_51300 [Mycolicibacterium mageritense]
MRLPYSAAAVTSAALLEATLDRNAPNPVYVADGSATYLVVGGADACGRLPEQFEIDCGHAPDHGLHSAGSHQFIHGFTLAQYACCCLHSIGNSGCS